MKVEGGESGMAKINIFDLPKKKDKDDQDREYEFWECPFPYCETWFTYPNESELFVKHMLDAHPSDVAGVLLDLDQIMAELNEESAKLAHTIGETKTPDQTAEGK